MERKKGDIRGNSADIVFRSSLREAIMSSSSMGRDGHSLTLSIQPLFCLPLRCRPPFKVSYGWLWWRVEGTGGDNSKSCRIFSLSL